MDTQMKRGKFWDHRLETMPMEELAEKIEKPLLNRQLAFVFKHSPFYQKKLREAGIDSLKDVQAATLEDIPYTDKAEIIQDQQESPPFGNLLAAPWERVIRIHRTSGYSGKPVLIALTKKDADETAEAGARMFWCAGVRPGDTVIHCLNFCLWIGGLTDHLSLEHTGATVVPYGVGNSKRLLELILYLRPTGISCTPSYLSRLEPILKEEFGLLPRDLGLEKGIFGGEAGLQNPEFRAVLEEKWGIRAIDANFGVSDVLSAFGSECEYRQGLHFHGQGIIAAELVDPQSGKPMEIREGQMGEFVYTNLKREAQPLVRFRSRDIARIVQIGRCQCGRTSFCFRILGRCDDMLVVKGINIFPDAIGILLAKFTLWLTTEFEIHLDEPPPFTCLQIFAETKAGFPQEKKVEIQEAVQREIKQKLECAALINLVPFGHFPPEEGKARRIKRNY